MTTRSAASSHPRSGVALAVILLASIVAACGEIPEPAGFVAPTSTTTGGQPAGDEAAATVDDPQTELTADQSTFVPTAPVDYVPDVLLAVDGQVWRSAGGAAPEPAPGFPGVENVVQVVDDLLGGLVVERAAPEQQIVWLQQGANPETIESGAVQLLDVGYDGSPVAVVLRGDELVERIRLADNERSVMVALRPEEQLLSLSAAGSLHALAISNDQCGAVLLYTSDGEQVDLPAPGEPDCIVPRRPAYGAVALSPGGRTMAYTVVTYRADGIPLSTELRLRNLTTGTDYATHQVGDLNERVESLAFDGQRVVYARRGVDGAEVAVLSVGDDAPATRIDIGPEAQVASVSFARLPLAGER